MTQIKMPAGKAGKVEAYNSQNNSIKHDVLLAPLVSGYGQTHSDKYQPFTSINVYGIRALVDDPQAVDKAQAQWLIPSTLASRIFKEQELNGNYCLLWADLDTDPKPLSEVSAFIASLLDNDNYEVYASRSAKADYQKGRVIIPLDKPLCFSDWQMCQSILNEKLNAKGFTPDPANLRAAQLCYLPNRGEFYESYSQREGFMFNPMLAWGDDIEAMRQEHIRRCEELEALSKAAKTKREALSHSDLVDTIGVFNNAYSVHEILTMAGYDQRGHTFRHPHSESGSYSASVKDNRVHTLSTADPLYSDGKGAHDAFSAFTVLFANGDHNQALKLAGDSWLSIAGESYNTVKQREYMQNKELANVMDFDATTHADDVTPSPINFKLVSSTELTAKQKHTQWLVKGLIGSDNMGLVFGQSGHGKSFFVLDMAFCIATGLDFFGHKVTQGSVVYIAGEGHTGLTKRLRALEIKYNTQAPKLFLSETSAALIDAGSVRDVRAAIDAICSDASLVIVDTLHRNFGAGDENSATDFGVFCNNVDSYLRKDGEGVLIVHHSGHADADRSRGSSSIKAAMDYEYKVTKSSNIITVTNTKMKDDEPPEAMRFEATAQAIGWFDEEDGKEFTSLILNATNEKVSSKLLKGENKLGLDAFELAASHGYSNGLDIEKWRTSFYSLHDGNADAKRKAFSRVKKSLVESGHLINEGDTFSYADIGQNSALNIISVTP